jgi:hypothetical protein
MPKYIVNQYETWVQSYLIEADSRGEAINKVFNGSGSPIDGRLEYVEINTNKGMSFQGNEDIVEELREIDKKETLGIVLNDAYIESIQSVTLNNNDCDHNWVITEGIGRWCDKCRETREE